MAILSPPIVSSILPLSVSFMESPVPFSDAIKREARRRSNFICAFCHRRGFIEVHHIIPEARGGPDTIENACPLCPTCHSDYGDSEPKRLQLREMRDLLWENNERRPLPESERVLTEGLDRIQVKLDAGMDQNAQFFSELKKLILTFHATSMQTINATATIGELSTATDIVVASMERDSKRFVLEILLPEGRVIDLDAFKELFRSLAGRVGDIEALDFQNAGSRNWIATVDYKHSHRSARIDGLKLSLEREGYKILQVTPQ